MDHVIDQIIQHRDGFFTVRSRNADDTAPGCWRVLARYESRAGADRLIARRASLRPRVQPILEPVGTVKG
jgi:hypothetical protein